MNGKTVEIDNTDAEGRVYRLIVFTQFVLAKKFAFKIKILNGGMQTGKSYKPPFQNFKY